MMQPDFTFPPIPIDSPHDLGIIDENPYQITDVMLNYYSHVSGYCGTVSKELEQATLELWMSDNWAVNYAKKLYKIEPFFNFSQSKWQVWLNLRVKYRLSNCHVSTK